MYKDCDVCQRNSVSFHEVHGCLYCSMENSMKNQIELLENIVSMKMSKLDDMKKELSDFHEYEGRPLQCRIDGSNFLRFLPKGKSPCPSNRLLDHNYKCSICHGVGYYEKQE